METELAIVKCTSDKEMKYGLIVQKETVRVIMKELDPVGVQARSSRRLRRPEYRAKGSNYIWLIDGYDKLKPFGSCIHGYMS